MTYLPPRKTTSGYKGHVLTLISIVWLLIYSSVVVWNCSSNLWVGNETARLFEFLWRGVWLVNCCHTWNVFSNTGMSLQISEVVSLRPLISSAVASTSGSSPTSSTTHSCPMCRFTTTCSLLLTQHIRRHHDNWPFVCPHCDYRTHRSHDLKKHLRTHTGEKPYHCNLCPYQTSDPSNLSAHLKNRHSSVRLEEQVLLPLWWGLPHSIDKGSN